MIYVALHKDSLGYKKIAKTELQHVGQDRTEV